MSRARAGLIYFSPTSPTAATAIHFSTRRHSLLCPPLLVSPPASVLFVLRLPQIIEVNSHLNSFNKPPVNTIQMRPSFHPEGLFDENKVSKNYSAVACECMQ
ncbi:hypothetical protein PIB30_065861 [Stylosanthes scabra]|uniref:Uncharacterized protein n=1 Tax=Stylosanthes scabra TaxID=79078 RepID=A0ABU6ZKW7_9FABA|nr:hypothetical protein [Stylosanthes scabra]